MAGDLMYEFKRVLDAKIRDCVEDCSNDVWQRNIVDSRIHDYIATVFRVLADSIRRMQGPWNVIAERATDFTMTRLGALAHEIMYIYHVSDARWEQICNIFANILLYEMTLKNPEAHIIQYRQHVLDRFVEIAQMALDTARVSEKTSFSPFCLFSFYILLNMDVIYIFRASIHR